MPETTGGKWLLIVGFLCAEAMVLGPMISMLPTWAAGWEPRYLGLFLLGFAGPVVTFFLPAQIAALVQRAVDEAERRRRAALEDRNLAADHRLQDFQPLGLRELSELDEGNEP